MSKTPEPVARGSVWIAHDTLDGPVMVLMPDRPEVPEGWRRADHAEAQQVLADRTAANAERPEESIDAKP